MAPIGIIGFTICTVCALITIPFPESPRLLLARERYDEFRTSIDTIARWNRTTVDWSKIDVEGQVKSFGKANEVTPFMPGDIPVLQP